MNDYVYRWKFIEQEFGEDFARLLKSAVEERWVMEEENAENKM